MDARHRLLTGEQVELLPKRLCVGIALIGRAVRSGRPAFAGKNGSKRLDDMLARRDKGRAFPDQLVRALSSRVERRPGHGENLPTLIQSEARRDQRARAASSLDDHNPKRQA